MTWARAWARAETRARAWAGARAGARATVVKSLMQHSLFQPASSILRGPSFARGALIYC